MGGVELGKRLSSSGIPKNVWVVDVSLLCHVSREDGSVGHDSCGRCDFEM